MKTIQGDLIELALKAEFDLIIHGCNCHCSMGAGIAQAIKKTFPEAYQADLQTAKGDRSKLGDFSFALIEREDLQLIIVNAYTQFDFSGSGVLVDYEALRSVMAKMKLRYSGFRIGYPKIGAGLAKGDWVKIEKIICEELDAEDHCLVEFEKAEEA